jgi:hypothetical protein
MGRRLHCTRCDREVLAVGGARYWVWAKRAWYGGLLGLCALMPIVMAEITVLLPLALVFAAAAGPVHGLARERPTCADCGAELDGRVPPTHP